MDLQTLFLISGLLISALIGDAAMFGKAVRVSVTVPPALVQQGITNLGAERLLMTEMDKLDRITSVLAIPTVDVIARPTFLSAFGRIADLDPVVEVIQHRVGINTIAISGMIVAEKAGPGLSMYVMIVMPEEADAEIVVHQPDGNVGELLARTALRVTARVAPYRSAMLAYLEGREGQADKFTRARTIAETTLGAQWNPKQSHLRVLMHNMLALLALQRNDQPAADQRLEAALRVPFADPDALALIKVNQATLAIANRKWDEAQELLYHVDELRRHLPKVHAHIEIIEALYLWGTGKRGQAERMLLRSAERLPGNRDAHQYLARLYEQEGRQEEAARQRRISEESRDYTVDIPSFISAAFWIDPVNGGLLARPALVTKPSAQ